MAIMKCKVCGVDLQVSPDAAVLQCPHCGATHTVKVCVSVPRKRNWVLVLAAVGFSAVLVTAGILWALIGFILPANSYKEALTLMEKGAYVEAAAAFEALGAYKDSAQRADFCREAQLLQRYMEAQALLDSGSYEEATGIFRSLGDFSDSREKLLLCQTLPLSDQYAQAMALMQAGKYTQAMEILTELEDFQDAKEQLILCEQAICYGQALSLMEDGKYLEAIDLFKTLGSYADSRENITLCKQELSYAEALGLMAEGNYAQAIAAFEKLEGFQDSRDKILQCVELEQKGRYAQALQLIAQEEYETARELLLELGEYMDAAKKAESCIWYTYGRGDKVVFGRYEQYNNTANYGKEPIEWFVIARENGRLLLISRYSLDSLPYHDYDGAVSWDQCTLRKWLNGTFLSEAFTKEERARIATTELVNNGHPSGYPGATKNTFDKVFLLSAEEAYRYFDEADDRMTWGTEYCNRDNPFADRGGLWWWWLRSPGDDPQYAAYVTESGEVSQYGWLASDGRGYVCPAIWVIIDP